MIKPTANSRFAKAGVWCFYDSEELNSSFVYLIKFSAKNTRLRKAAKRYKQPSHTDSVTINRQKKSQPHILAHLVLPDTQADPSQNQKS